MWSDFECPFCGRVEQTVEQIRKLYGNKVRIVWKNLPVPIHPNALLAAESAMAAGEQGKFWEMHDQLFKNQNSLSLNSILGYAKQLGLDQKKFRAAIDSHKFKAAIDADVQAGGKLGARGTPTLFINGKIVIGAQPFDVFKAKIDDALRTAKPYDQLMKEARADVSGMSTGAPPTPAHTTLSKKPLVMR
jgi:protein-disulfide isomerase